MKSVLISVDFVYKQDGTLHPTELNTSTKDELSIREDLTNDNFISEVSDYFNHELLNTFMVENNLSKIVTISVGGDDRLYKAFANYYGIQYENIVVDMGTLTVPEVENSDDTLIIRIAYDTYAIIDDLYARDNYEFHNLISNESFSSPVTFTEDNFDTITEFESSQDGVIPNYIVKARTPGYIDTEYPVGYRFESNDELVNLKNNLGSDEFIQKFEFNNSLGLIDGRTHHLRTMSLVCGDTLEVLNIVQYKSINTVSTLNDKLVYEFEIDSNKKLDDLFLSKYYPNYLSKIGVNYHSDMNDSILKSDDSIVLFSDLQIGDKLKYILFNNDPEFDGEYAFSSLNQFSLGESTVQTITSAKKGTMANLTITYETYGTFQFHDGVGNNYMVRKPNQSNDVVLWTKAGVIEEGDEIMIYHKTLNSVIPFNVSTIFFDKKDLNLYLINLNPQPKFLVQIDDNGLFATELFLIQHNACGVGCATGAVCGKCADCGKNAGGCVQCGGLASQDCISDARLKENLVLIGQSEKGINIYEFNYIERPEKYQGVIAQELLNTEFESAVIVGSDGYYSVNYEKLDVEFKQID